MCEKHYTAARETPNQKPLPTFPTECGLGEVTADEKHSVACNMAAPKCFSFVYVLLKKKKSNKRQRLTFFIKRFA